MGVELVVFRFRELVIDRFGFGLLHVNPSGGHLGHQLSCPVLDVVEPARAVSSFVVNVTLNFPRLSSSSRPLDDRDRNRAECHTRAQHDEHGIAGSPTVRFFSWRT
jgi:hypothetical protein